MHQKQCLPGERSVSTIFTNLTESHFRNFSPRTISIGAATPVGNSVVSANRVRHEAVNRAGIRPGRTGAQIGFGRQPYGRERMLWPRSGRRGEGNQQQQQQQRQR
ncbi:hypothetical protein GQ457_17G023060 [Hibiscus cannabinus]